MGTPSSVTVIGGGVIGLSCGWRLARAGLRVTLLEANRSMPLASGAALGVLTPASPLGDAAVHRLHRQSLEMFGTFLRELEQDSQLPLEALRCGSLHLITTDSQYLERQGEAEAIQQERWQIDGQPALELLPPEICQRLEPAATVGPQGALHNRVTARVPVQQMLRGLRQAALQTGVVIHEDCPVEKIEVRDRQVQGIHTAGGWRACHQLVVCAGVWSSRLHPLLDDFAQMEPVRGQSLVIETEGPLLKHILHRNEAYLVPQDADLMVIGSTTEPEAGFDTGNSPAGIHQVLGASLETVPSLGRASIRELRSGLRPRGPDEKPYIGSIPGAQGLWVATGHYKTGFGFAPLTAEAITQLVVEGGTGFNLETLAPRRRTI